jgi:hypothetical protein
MVLVGVARLLPNLCGSQDVCYWRLTSGGTVQRVPVPPISGAPRAVKGANNEVYAYPSIGDEWSKICTLKNAFSTGVQAGDCTMLGACTSGPNCDTTANPPVQKPRPSGSPTPIYVGPELSQWAVPAEMECQLQSSKKYKCFGAYSLRAVAADPTTNYKVYVVYQASAASFPPYQPGIYFTRSNPGSCPNNCFGTFTDPFLIAADTSTVFNYDPQITVDLDGTIVVSYSAIAKAPAITNGTATVFARISTDGGSNFSGMYTIASWNSSTIPYHCGRGMYFVGEYRDSNAIGGRSYLGYPSGGSTFLAYNQLTRWLNRWNVGN